MRHGKGCGCSKCLQKFQRTPRGQMELFQRRRMMRLTALGSVLGVGGVTGASSAEKAGKEEA